MNRKSIPVRTALLGLLSLLALLIVLMGILKPAKKQPPVSPEKPMPVSVLVVQPTNTADIVFLPALIEANVDALLSAEKSGRIVSMLADRGDRVEKVQLLLQIDDRVWQANLRQASIAADEARKNHERFKQLQASGAVAEREFDSIERAYIQAESQAEEARINIEQCRVESPIAGIVNDRFAEAGEYVQPGTPVFQVVDKATVKIVVQVPEKAIFAIRQGSRMRFTVQPLPGRVFEGTVTFVAAQADSRNNAFRTEITVENADAALRPGMIAQIEFLRGTKSNMVSLPMSAVLPSKGDHIVYLSRNGQAVRRRVLLDTITRERALVAQGLEAGDRVIVEGNRTLSDGQRVAEIERGIAE